MSFSMHKSQSVPETLKKSGHTDTDTGEIQTTPRLNEMVNDIIFMVYD